MRIQNMISQHLFLILLVCFCFDKYELIIAFILVYCIIQPEKKAKITIQLFNLDTQISVMHAFEKIKYYCSCTQ